MYLVPLIIFSIIAILILLVPYFKSAPEEQEVAADIGVYKAQLSELESDVERGIINDDEAKRSRTEIERRILKAADQAQAHIKYEKPDTIIAIAILAVLLLSTGLYAMLGTPMMPDYPKNMAQQAGTDEEYQKTEDLKAQLLAQLAKQPPEARGLVYLSRLEMSLGNYQAAAEALYQAHLLEPESFEVQLMYAESLIVAARERVTPAALVLLNKAARQYPDHPGPRYYLALADFQAGDVEIAYKEWVKISNSLEADSQLKPLVDFWVSRAEKELGLDQSLPETRAPSISDEQVEIIRNMDEGEQAELIHQMVLQLAEKQKQNPGNIEGWLRLSRAYMVLGQKQDAIAAMKSAVANAPDEQKDNLQKEVEKLTNLQ